MARLEENMRRFLEQSARPAAQAAARRTYSEEEQTAFYTAHPEKFQGQLWERCRCGREPVNMPSHRCIECLMAGQDHPRIPGAAAPIHSTEPDGA